MKREDEVELAGRVSLFTLFKTREFRREEREKEEERGASVIFPPLRVFCLTFLFLSVCSARSNAIGLFALLALWLFPFLCEFAFAALDS